MPTDRCGSRRRMATSALAVLAGERGAERELGRAGIEPLDVFFGQIGEDAGH